jgi:hypothetical protein
VLDTESSWVFWIPAFAGMTNSPQAAGNTTPRDFDFAVREIACVLLPHRAHFQALSIQALSD